ncbi:MAG: MFS transporter [Hyphomicrobiaceae bacterium]
MPDGTQLAGSGRSVTDIDSRGAWLRLLVALAASTIGGVGMWSVVVVLPAVQADFGVTRSEASLAYTLTMLGFGFGGILMGNFADRFGIFRPLVAAAVTLGLGYIATAYATSMWQFAVAHGLLIGLLGSSVSFGPMLADISHWFERRRGIAVAICASGNYLAGTVWPPIVQHMVTAYGWRLTHVALGLFCIVGIVPLAMLLRRRHPRRVSAAEAAAAAPAAKPVPPPMPLGVLQVMLIVAGISCCVAMSMPQVHIVAYCGDLGYGLARGAEMLSLMLGFGIISRLLSGLIADKIGGVATLLMGSVLQGIALLLYVPFDGLVSLYIISALFGLFQGGIVPSYALIVRQYFPPEQAGARVGMVLTATLVGMALGGWISGLIFDLTGSYRAAFLNGIAWNALNVMIVLTLIVRGRRRSRPPIAGAFQPA